ncbi:MAG: PulJ/GspJ family protein, partial [Bythopirellula sp.]
MLRTPRKSRDSRFTTRDSAHGLTLIEMLISMAVTLLMMAAVVNLFANVGAGVRNRRASMELGGQLRLARARLFKDLAGATCAARPKLPSDDHDDGYLEIIDGLWSDAQPSILTDGIINATQNNFELDYTTSLVPSGSDPQVLAPATQPRARTTNDITNGGALGDRDSVLMLTV